MSPLLLRRYRAERLLRREYDLHREQVLAGVRARLHARRVTLDNSDLEECYTQAWHGLYVVLMRGESIDNLLAWLTIVCFRRAIDEHRARAREQPVPLPDVPLHASTGHLEPDLIGELEDRTHLRQVFEALRERLSPRERQAATLCYLQGLSRAQAAAQMGISVARMGKLMDGRGPGHPGVAAKVDELMRTIRAGGWCEQQASLMRALAFGILDPDGERYRLAELHTRECPACRAYVLSLRGLAAVLPPFVLPFGPLVAGVGGGIGVVRVGGGAKLAGVGGRAGVGGGGSAGVGASVGVGAGASGATGGWLPLGGSLATKLAAGCLLLAGVGGGCAALIVGAHHPARAGHRRDLALGGGTGSAGIGAVLARGVSPGGVFTPAGSGFGSTEPSAQRVRDRPTRAASHRIRSLTAPHGPMLDQAQLELGFERAPAAAVARKGARINHQAQPRSPSPPPAGHATLASSRYPRGAAGEFEVR
jgi:RNA polymerase sigma factor (sigma-70 family)